MWCKQHASTDATGAEPWRDPIRDHEQLMFAMFQAMLSAGTVSFGNIRTLEKSSRVSSSWTNGRVSLCRSVLQRRCRKLVWECRVGNVCGNTVWSLRCRIFWHDGSS